ncbi:MAG: hypothetical protein M1820_006363 [Bogoriella megaspora]|nr:MAG: hypothetical protein M1820_006363 [Bogoriella megaspora]
MLTSSGALDITQAISFSMILVPSTYVVLNRDNYERFSWIYLSSFCVLRIVEAALQLQGDFEGSSNLNSGAMMLKEIAVALLLLSPLCLLHEGLVYIKAAAALYVLLWVLLAAQTIRLLLQPKYDSLQRLLQQGVAVSLPFFAIRVLYLLSSVATLSHETNPFSGPIAVRIFLGFLPEVAITCALVAVGLIMRNREESTLGSDEWRGQSHSMVDVIETGHQNANN